ncbi:MAG: hypothetical protein IKC26_11170 [Clostridia bacterium]|nr:hypothetical protein [Clostridia bacterium]MBR2908587.1 hypothetical protein [Clostridia bacterium]
MRTATVKEKKEKRPPTGTFQKQKRFTILFAILVVLLAVAVGVTYYFVRLDRTSFEHNGIVYRVVQRDGVYVLVNGDGIVCEKAYGGDYYMTDDGEMLLSVNKESGKYSVYAAVEGLEYDKNDINSENAYYVSTQTVLVFPAIPQSNMQAIEMHNEHGSFTFYRNKDGDFTLSGVEDYLMTYDAQLFSAFAHCTGTMIAQSKIVDPIVDENGTFSEYGLADSDTYWTITTLENKVYKVIVGDKTPSGDGYYIQYVECSYPTLNADGTVKEMTETPRKAVYITLNQTMNTSAEYVEKPFHSPVEDLMIPQLVYNVTMSDYFDVQNYVLMKNDKPFVAFDYIDIAERSISERATTPFVMLLEEHLGLTANSNKIMVALQSFSGMTFTRCVKLAPTTEDLIEYGIYTNPVHAFTEKDPSGKTVIYLILPQENGGYVLAKEGEETLSPSADGTYLTEGGAVLRINAEKGTGETVSGNGTWDYSYTCPYSIYYNFDVEHDGTETTTEQLVFFSGVSDTNTVYAYSPIYGMLVEIPSYELEFLRWSLFDWIETLLYDVNIAYAASVKIDAPSKSPLSFTLNNADSKQGNFEPFSDLTRFYLSDKSGSYLYYTEETLKQSGINKKDAFAYHLKKVNGKYGVYNSKGVEYPVALSAYFHIADRKATKSDYYVSRFGMPSGGESEGWFRGKAYLLPNDQYVICDEGSGHWGTANYSVNSSGLTVMDDSTGKLVSTDAFRDYYEVLLYASIEQEHILSEAEESALIGDPANLQLRIRIKTSEQDLIYEFYYLTSRKSYLRISGNGGETFTGGMYVLTARVDKLINDADKIFTGEEIDSTSKN